MAHTGIASSRRVEAPVDVPLPSDSGPTPTLRHVGSPVEVLDVRRDGDTTFVTVRTDGVFHPPLAPSSLHFDNATTVPLDVVVSTDDHTAEFRTNATVLDAVAGRAAELQQWWGPTHTTPSLMSNAPGSESARRATMSIACSTGRRSDTAAPSSDGCATEIGCASRATTSTSCVTASASVVERSSPAARSNRPSRDALRNDEAGRNAESLVTGTPEYVVRVVDAELDELMAGLPAVSLEGPKAVGKTETACRRAASIVRLDDVAQREIVAASPDRLTVGETPILIDESARQTSSRDLGCHRARRRPLDTVSLGALLAGSRPAVAGASSMDLADYADEIVRSGFPAIRQYQGRLLRAQLDG